MAGPTNQVKPFVEGVKSITNAGAIGERIQLDWPLKDSDYLPNNGWWSGGIDDLRIYDRQLADAEIAALYGDGNGYALGHGSNDATPIQARRR